MSKRRQPAPKPSPPKNVEATHPLRPLVVSSAVNGLFLLAGVIITVIASYVSGTSLQDREARGVDRNEQVQAKGAARILRAELVTAGHEMIVLEHDLVFRPPDPSYQVAIAGSELRLLASRMNAHQWDTTQIALANVDALRGYVNTQLARGRRRIDRYSACLIRQDIESISAATKELAAVGDTPKEPPFPDLPSLDCSGVKPPDTLSEALERAR